MEATLATTVWILFTFLLLGGVIGFAVGNTIRRKKHREFPIRLARMMARLGIEPGAAADIQREYYMHIAGGRCRHCRAKKDCDAWQASRTRSSTAPVFCPNVRYLHLASVEGKHAARH